MCCNDKRCSVAGCGAAAKSGGKRCQKHEDAMKKAMKIVGLVLSLLLPNAALAQVYPGSTGGTVASGSPVSGCTAYSLVYIDSAGNLACALAPVNGNVTTAGRGIFSVLDTITDSATANFLNVTGANIAVRTAAHNSAYFSTTTGGSSAQPIRGILSTMGAGYTGTNRVSSGRFENAVVSTGAIAGVLSDSGGSIGVEGRSTAGTVSVGVAGTAVGAGTSAIGVVGQGSGGSTSSAGGLFNLGCNSTTLPTSSGIVADNCNFASDIARFQDNGTAVVTIADGGATTFTQAVNANSGVAIPANNALYWASGNGGSFYGNLAVLTPDALAHFVSTNSNSTHVAEVGDNNYDFNNGACGTVICTDPAIIIHSAVADTTQYNHLAAWGQAGGALKTLTESAATALVRIPIANNSRASGELHYEIYATDGTDMQVRTSRIRYAMTNKAGAELCTITAMDGAAVTNETNDDNASQITAGTLTYAVACTNNAADTMDITFNAVSSLVQTTLQANWSVVHRSPGQPARQ